jgi:clan AA aspartic protease (TIGR02281 family)
MATLKELQNQIGVTDFSLKAVFDKNENTTNYLSYINEEKRIIVVVQKNIAIELTKDSNLNLQWETKIKTIDSKDYIVYEAIKEREPATTQGVKLKKNTKKIIIGSTIAVIAILILFFGIVWEQKKSQVTITMQEKNGVFYVPCKINSVEKEFLFDTGATDIMISLWDVMDIIRKGYMNENDFSGDTYTQIANGGIMKGTKIILKTVEIGGLTLTDIPATIVYERTPVNCLGLSAIKQLGDVTIKGNQLIIKNPKKAQKYIVSNKNTNNNVASNKEFAQNNSIAFTKYTIPNVGHISIPNTMEEKQEDDFKSLKKDINVSRMIFLPKRNGKIENVSNEINTQVFIRTIVGNYGDYESLEDFTKSELNELKLLLMKQIGAKVEFEKVNGMTAIKYSSLKDNILETQYIFNNNDRQHSLLLKYSLANKEMWEPLFSKVLNSFTITNVR